MSTPASTDSEANQANRTRRTKKHRPRQPGQQNLQHSHLPEHEEYGCCPLPLPAPTYRHNMAAAPRPCLHPPCKPALLQQGEVVQRCILQLHPMQLRTVIHQHLQPAAAAAAAAVTTAAAAAAAAAAAGPGLPAAAAVAVAAADGEVRGQARRGCRSPRAHAHTLPSSAAAPTDPRGAANIS